jgi:hypothetical protein
MQAAEEPYLRQYSYFCTGKARKFLLALYKGTNTDTCRGAILALLEVVFLGVLDEIRVVDSLAQADQQVENVCVVVEDSARADIRIELGLRLRVNRLVVIRLEWVERVLTEYYVFRRYNDVL